MVRSVLRERCQGDTLWAMKLRLDLLEYLTAEDIIEEGLANNHRYKAEPVLAQSGVGYLAPATPEDRARELARSEALVQKLIKRSQKNGKQNGSAS